MPKRLTSAEVADLQAKWADGWSALQLASEFGVSERHVRRLCGDVEREPAAVLFAVGGSGSIAEAAQALLDGLQLEEAGDLVLARALLATAAMLDRADARSAPALVSKLQELVRVLQWRNRQPDTLDLLQRRRALRRAGVGVE